MNAAIFHLAERSAVDRLAARLITAEYRRGHPIFTQGEPADRMFIMISGTVKITRRKHDGRENVLEIVGLSDMFGELSLLDPSPRASSAIAVTDVVAVSMDRDTFLAWIADCPEIAERLLRVLARRLRRVNDNVADLIYADVPGRLAKRLLQLAQKFGTQKAGGLSVVHGLTQEELAQLVGSTRETVNEILSDFAQRGWLQWEGTTVRILDSARLVELSGLATITPPEPH